MLVQPAITMATRATHAGDQEWINLADFAIGEDVLGPGRRALIWVQGCPRRCPGCITATMQRFDVDREWISPMALGERVLSALPLEGITLLGGEPFSHAKPLRSMIDWLRSQSDLSVVTYTGHSFEDLRDQKHPEWDALIAVTDLLVDGEYRADKHSDLVWRGSANQRLIALSDRYRALISRIQDTREQRLQIEIDIKEGKLRLLGIPDRMMLTSLRTELAARGISLGFE